jgi:hypothetical protein
VWFCICTRHLTPQGLPPFYIHQQEEEEEEEEALSYSPPPSSFDQVDCEDRPGRLSRGSASEPSVTTLHVKFLFSDHRRRCH